MLLKEFNSLPYEEMASPTKEKVYIERSFGRWFRRHDNGFMEELLFHDEGNPNHFILRGESGFYVQDDDGWSTLKE